MDPAQLRAYAAGYDRRREARLGERRAAADRARELVPAVAAACRTAGATRVRLFGSLVTGLLGETPDIDVAVDGLPPEKYFDVLAAVTRLTAPIDVDLVDTAGCRPELLSRIETDGVDE
jgi:predicted nucleotidyltransferase